MLRPVLVHFGERAFEPDLEVDCIADGHSRWAEAVQNAGGPDAVFGRCRNCGESSDPEAPAIRAWLVQAFESATHKG